MISIYFCTFELPISRCINTHNVLIRSLNLKCYVVDKRRDDAQLLFDHSKDGFNFRNVSSYDFNRI